jgi:hypothetical protein
LVISLFFSPGIFIYPLSGLYLPDFLLGLEPMSF